MSAEATGRGAVHWHRSLEEYFADIAEKSHCYSWLHKRAEELYSSRSVWIDIPVIVLGVVNASVSVGSSSLFPNPEYSSIGVGAVILFTSILNTISNYFGFAKRSEGHRIASLSFAKLHRFLKVELSLPRAERIQPHDFLKFIRNEYDRLNEVSPLIPPRIIAMFKQRFTDEKYAQIAKPEETNGLEEVVVFRDVAATTPEAMEHKESAGSFPVA